MTKILTKILDLSLYVNSKKDYFSSFSKGGRTKTDLKKIEDRSYERERERERERKRGKKKENTEVRRDGMSTI